MNFCVFTTGFSDQDLIFGIQKASSHVNREPKIIKPCQLKNYDLVKFFHDSEKVNWDLILKHDSVHTFCHKFGQACSFETTQSEEHVYSLYVPM